MTDDHRLNPAAILKRHGLRPRQGLGQNFLHDPSILRRIVDAAGVLKTDVVLEIGCGLGSLTEFLGRAAARVVAVEVDSRLAAIAEDSLSELHNVRIVRGDFLELSLGGLGLPPGYIVAANIPYYVTSPILRRLLESDPRPGRIVLTVQREVAARICAKPPEMSILAVSVQAYGNPRIVAEVPAKAFYPVPKVDSAVVRVDIYEQAAFPMGLRSVFFNTVRAGFSQPRKMLRNTLAAGLDIAAADAQGLLQGVGIDPRRRAETLTLDEWTKLSEAVSISGLTA